MSFLLQNPGEVATLTWQHIQMTGIALAVATVVAVPLGVVAHRTERIGTAITGLLGIIYTIPSLALMILLIEPLGLTRLNVIVALIFYDQIILVRNVVAGLTEVDPALLEAADGMGMSAWQRWWRVELPLALPVILAGVRVAAVVSIAIATIGAKFGAGGLGVLLFEGIQQPGRYDKILAGSLAVSALALAVNYLVLALETRTRRPDAEAPAGRPLTAAAGGG